MFNRVHSEIKESANRRTLDFKDTDEAQSYVRKILFSSSSPKIKSLYDRYTTALVSGFHSAYLDAGLNPDANEPHTRATISDGHGRVSRACALIADNTRRNAVKTFPNGKVRRSHQLIEAAGLFDDLSDWHRRMSEQIYRPPQLPGFQDNA